MHFAFARSSAHPGLHETHFCAPFTGQSAPLDAKPLSHLHELATTHGIDIARQRSVIGCVCADEFEIAKRVSLYGCILMRSTYQCTSLQR